MRPSYRWLYIGVVLSFVLTSEAVQHAIPAFAEDKRIYKVALVSPSGLERSVQGTREGIFAYAEAFEDRGDYNFARRSYERLIETNPADVRAYILLGRLYSKHLEQYVKAIKYYRHAGRLVSERTNPEGKAFCQVLVADTYRTLAEKSDSLIYFVQAIGAYEKALSYDPRNYEAMFYLASCRLNAQDFDRAIHLYKYLVENAPETPWAKLSKTALKVARKEQRRARNHDNRTRRL